MGQLVAADGTQKRSPANLIEASGLKGLVSHDLFRSLIGPRMPKGCELVIQTHQQENCTMKDLNYQLSKLCRDNRDGSFSTQATRSRILDLIASQLQALGFRRMQSRSLKPKHIDALVTHWQEQGIGIGTLKNRLSALRWWAKKVNKPSIIAKDNDVYDIGKRDNVARKSKALKLDEKKLSAISDQHVRLSIRLQAAFGLRREESIKFSPTYAMQDDHIKLKPSWTKGGRVRTVPIRNDEQRQLLDEIKEFAKALEQLSSKKPNCSSPGKSKKPDKRRYTAFGRRGHSS